MKQLNRFEIITMCENESDELKMFLETRGHEVPACVNAAIVLRLSENRKEIKHQKELLPK